MNKYFTWTIGCQMNVADTEKLESAMNLMGLDNTDDVHDADVVVVNSCVVRSSAEDKVTGFLTSLKPLKKNNSDLVIALMGCMVGDRTHYLEDKFPYVDLFMKPQQFDPLIYLIGDKLGIDPEGCIGNLTVKPNISAYVPVIHGCDKFCSFCIIPYRRGRELSRKVSDVSNEIELLSRRGVKEVTLLGQNIDSYGHDLSDSVDLSSLLEAVHDISDIQRIRFLTSHPNDMSNKIIEAVSALDRVCEHINLPFQAGDDEVLSRMRRGYTRDQYIRLIDKIRETVPNVSLATDVIVGFCGETEQQFEKTLDLLKSVEFDKVHSAAYSTRKGTIADRKFEDNISLSEKKDRLSALDTLQKEIQTKINLKLHGETTEILVEGVKNGKIFGRNRNDKIVYIEDEVDNKSLVGTVKNVKITKTGPWSLTGSLSN